MSLNKMEYVRLGRSGLKVSKIILGCMSYGDPAWQPWVLKEDDSLEHFKFAFDRGVNTWDTANVYSNGASEKIVKSAIAKYSIPREELVIMTKCFFVVHPTPGGKVTGASEGNDPFPNQHGLSRKHIFASVDASLERLGMDYIDILQCHRFDYETPIEETMQALHDVVQSGKVRYIGMSSCFAYQFHTMQNYAITHNLTPFVSMQNFHNAAYREEEREMLPLLQQIGVGSTPYSPLSKGLLSRPVGGSSARSKVDPMFKARGWDKPDEPTTQIINAVEAIAKARGISMSQVALAWSLATPGITAPIVGSTSLKNIEDSIGAVQVKLTDEELKSISEGYVSKKIAGHA